MKEKVYLTKRLIIHKSKKAFSDGAKKAMKLNGYIIIAHNGWIVKKYKDGQMEKIKKLVAHPDKANA